MKKILTKEIIEIFLNSTCVVGSVAKVTKQHRIFTFIPDITTEYICVRNGGIGSAMWVNKLNGESLYLTDEKLMNRINDLARLQLILTYC